MEEERLEAITIFIRECFNSTSRNFYLRVLEKTGWKSIPHFHHGYWGLILAPLSFYYQFEWGFVVGMALFFSDLIHHFLYLWPVHGNPGLTLYHVRPS